MENVPDIINTAVQGFTLTPVVSRPQVRVMVYVLSGSGPMALFTICNASSFSSSSSPFPATFTIVKFPNTLWFLNFSLNALAAFTPGSTHSVCRNMLWNSALEYGYRLSSSFRQRRLSRLSTSRSCTNRPLSLVRKNSRKLNAFSSSLYSEPSSEPRSYV